MVGHWRRQNFASCTGITSGHCMYKSKMSLDLLQGALIALQQFGG